MPVVFLHGWALGSRTTAARSTASWPKAASVAPALPRFAGTPDLPRRQFSFAGYADWVDGFLDASGVDEKVLLMGHSFGGGVAIKAAHPAEAVGTLVLINSIGGLDMAIGLDAQVDQRAPVVDWGSTSPSDIWPLAQATRCPCHPRRRPAPTCCATRARSGRSASLPATPTSPAARKSSRPFVARRRVGCTRRRRAALRVRRDVCCTRFRGEVIEGSHSWLLADPDQFARS